jgi:hypothetical protein
MTDVALAYGKGSVTLSVPEEAAGEDRFVAARAPPPGDPLALYREALPGQPLPLPEPIVVVVPDGTRPASVPAAFEALRPLLRGRDVRVVVGAGLHPARAPDSPWPVEIHDARSADLADLGSESGIRLLVHPAVVRAGALLVVGATTPHYLAGFSGGPKGLFPGIAGEATILALHRLADATRTGLLAGNPFAGAIRACARRIAPPAFSLNLCVGPRGPFAATFGPLEEAHDRAVALYRDACAIARPAPADVVFADAGGDPVDATLLQAHKAFEAAFSLVRPGGVLVLAARCGEGFGHPEFRRRLRLPDPLEGPFHPYARTAAEWRRKAAACRAMLVTEMDLSGLGVRKATPAEAAREARPGARVLWARAAQDLLFR